MSRSRLRPTLLLSDREARSNRWKLATVIDLDLGLILVAEGASYDQRVAGALDPDSKIGDQWVSMQVDDAVMILTSAYETSDLDSC